MPPKASDTPVEGGAETTPRAFMSYAWTSPEYQARVKALVDRLRSDGVDVVFDMYDLTAGDDAHHFMERIVVDATVRKVVIACDPGYKRKADAREGGAGTEAQILTPSLYNQGTEAYRERKFVAVIMEREEDGTMPVPAFYGGRLYINLSDEDQAEEEYDKLLHFLFGRPVHEKPPLGNAPAHILTPGTPSLGTSTRAARALRALRSNESAADGALADFFDAFTGNLPRFRITEEEVPKSRLKADWGELVISRLAQLKLHRDEAIDIFAAIARYRPDERAVLLR